MLVISAQSVFATEGAALCALNLPTQLEAAATPGAPSRALRYPLTRRSTLG